MAVELKVNAIPIEKTLEMMGKFGKQIPFAESKAINNTSLKVQAFEVKNIKTNFTTRSKWYLPRRRFGVNVKFANKRNLIGRIFSLAPWLQQHESGGTKTRKKKTPKQSKSKLLMPIREIRKDKTRLIPKKFSPAKLLADPTKKRVFFIDTPGGGLLLQRKGKGKKSKTKVLFFAETKAKIKPTLHFVKTGSKIINKIYKKEFGRALGFAIKTAGGNLKKDT